MPEAAGIPGMAGPGVLWSGRWAPASGGRWALASGRECAACAADGAVEDFRSGAEPGAQLPDRGLSAGQHPGGDGRGKDMSRCHVNHVVPGGGGGAGEGTIGNCECLMVGVQGSTKVRRNRTGAFALMGAPFRGGVTLTGIVRVSGVGRFAGHPVVGMVDGFPDKPDQVPVVKGINDMPPVLAGIHEAAETKFG
jgi:hypothetical protein